MKQDDDFISKLMDETYNHVEHPSNELSNQSVVSLADYFKKRETTNKTLNSPAAAFESFNGFFRITVAGQDLDVPEALNWVKPVNENGVLEVKDEAFSSVLSSLCGEKVNYLVIEDDTVSFYESLPSGCLDQAKSA